MTSKDVLKIYNKTEQAGIKFWVDGGWAVDALLGEQIRPHSDLDVAIDNDDVGKLRQLLEADGYREIKRDSGWNFVMGDDKGRAIDVHVFVTDAKGDIVDGLLYPKESLTGTGMIEGQTVRCISPKYMVEFIAPWIHKHGEKYLKAVDALCKKFGLEYPQEYKQFKK